jgi:predicted permease
LRYSVGASAPRVTWERILRILETIMSALDLRQAVRGFRRSPGVTATMVGILGLAIGAATAIFSVVYGVLLRPLPYPDPDRLVAIAEINRRGGYSRLADPNFDDFRDRSRTFAAMAKYTGYETSVAGGSEPTRTRIATVSGGFFGVLGVPPALGRPFAAEDLRLGAAPTAVVTDSYWRTFLGANRELSSLALKIENRSYAVIGVMPAGFAFPAGTGIWIPAELDRANTSRTSHNFYAVARVKNGVRVAQASADVSAIAKDIVERSEEKGEYLLADAVAVPLRQFLTGDVGSTLSILVAAVIFLLLVSCANVTNLLLSQAAARRQELAIRHALGASRGRLMRQFLVEAALLLAAGAAAGLLVASAGIRMLLVLAPADLPRLDEVSLRWPVLLFATGLSALVALGLGVATAARAAGRDPAQGLADFSRGQAGATVGSQRAGGVIVAAQVAVTVVLLVGSALLGRSLAQVLAVDPGFRTDGIVAMDLDLPYSEDPEAKARLAPFFARLFERLAAIPGVEAVAAANAVPLDGGLPDGLFLDLTSREVPSKMEDLGPLFQNKELTGTADYAAVTPRYFEALGIPLVSGRLFDERDQPDRPHAALVNAALARARWPGQDPIGRTLEFGNMDGDLRPLTVVGVVGDTREYGLEQPPRPTIYVNLLQRPRFASTVVMRSDADPRAVMAAARGVLRDVAPEVPPRLRTFGQIYQASLGSRRFSLTLLAAFAGTALVLAVGGIYGVLAYGVARRRREIGVRIALGATPRDIVRTIFGQGLAPVAVGAAAGVAGALALTRGLRSMLFGIGPGDPLTYVAVVALLAAVAVAACWLPARRGTRVDPVEALRA